MPNFIDDRHWGLLVFIGNKARSGKLKDADITVADIDLIIAAMQDRDRVIRELNAKVEAQDKIINFLSNAANAKSSELRALNAKLDNRLSRFV
jgi:prefoldin subunit 5